MDGYSGAEGVPVWVARGVEEDGPDEGCWGGDVEGGRGGEDGGGAGDDLGR